jgi:hypothetical protein
MDRNLHCLLAGFIVVVIGLTASDGECCQTAKTIYHVVSTEKAPPAKVEPITGWKEVPLPPCAFWVCGDEPEHRWTLKETAGAVEVEWLS